MVLLWCPCLCRLGALREGDKQRLTIIITQTIMNKIIYVAPSLDVEQIEVEHGFGLSGFGDSGDPGQDSGYNDYDEDL